MVYELNQAVSFFVNYVFIQYSQATPKPTALGQNIIFYLFLFKYCSKKPSWCIFLSAHHANHRLFIIIQEGAMHLGHSFQHSPASAESNSPHQSSNSHRLRPISLKKWAGAQWLRDLGTQGSSPSSFGSADAGRYSNSPPLCFTLLKMGRRNLILCSHLFLQSFNQATFIEHLS